MTSQTLLVTAAITGLTVLALLGQIRVGNRRKTAEMTVVETTEDYKVSEHETGLIQQWYTDQPCQRIYGIALSGHFSVTGLNLLKSREHVERVVRRLTERHPALCTCIRRDPHTSRATLRRYEVKPSGPHHAHPLGPMPLMWVSRKNEGTWHDVVQQYTHTDMDESKWLFRVFFVLNDDNSCSSQGEIIIISHHVISDGLSVAAMLKDLVHGLALNDEDLKTKLSPLPYMTLDNVIDLRPPLGTVVKVVGEDALPSSLRAKPVFWQGPQPDFMPDSTEGHFSTLSISADLFQAFKQVCKTHHVSVNSALTSILLIAEAEIIRKMQPNQVLPGGNISLKFCCPMGRAVRKLGSVSLDQVSVVVTTVEEIFVLPSHATADNTAYLWSLAEKANEITSQDMRQNLDYLGLLNFLPRDSITPWFIRDGNRFVLSRNNSVEISNLGCMSALDRLIDQDTAVSSLFEKPELTQVFMPLGRNYRGPVLAAGVATSHDNLTLSINCQLGQCGCPRHYVKGDFCTLVDKMKDVVAVDNIGDTTAGKRIICACPKEGLLWQYSHLVQEMIVNTIINSNSSSSK